MQAQNCLDYVYRSCIPFSSPGEDVDGFMSPVLGPGGQPANLSFSPLTPLPATHTSHSSVSPFPATHPKSPTCKSSPCHTSKKQGGWGQLRLTRSVSSNFKGKGVG